MMCSINFHNPANRSNHVNIALTDRYESSLSCCQILGSPKAYTRIEFIAGKEVKLPLVL